MLSLALVDPSRSVYTSGLRLQHIYHATDTSSLVSTDKLSLHTAAHEGSPTPSCAIRHRTNKTTNATCTRAPHPKRITRPLARSRAASHQCPRHQSRQRKLLPKHATRVPYRRKAHTHEPSAPSLSLRLSLSLSSLQGKPGRLSAVVADALRKATRTAGSACVPLALPTAGRGGARAREPR